MSDLLTLVYATMLPGLKELAREHGYALAIHGSMLRDFDLVAVPWADEVSTPAMLIQAIADKLKCYKGGRVDGPEEKPHGRLAWIIPMGAGLALDVSVMSSQPRREVRKQIDSGIPCPECSNITTHRDGCRTARLIERKVAALAAENARLREALDDLVAWTGTAKDADDWLAKARAAKKALEPRQDG